MDNSSQFPWLQFVALALLALLVLLGAAILGAGKWVERFERSVLQTRGSPSGLLATLVLRLIGRRTFRDGGLVVPSWLEGVEETTFHKSEDDRLANASAAFDPSIMPPPPLQLPEPPSLPQPQPSRPAQTSSIDATQIARLWTITNVSSPFPFADIERSLVATAVLPPVPEIPPPPRKPEELDVASERPTLIVPYYFKDRQLGTVGRAFVRPLNRLVRAAHADVIERYEHLMRRANRQAETASQINQRRRIEYEAAAVRLQNASDWREKIVRTREERYRQWKIDFNARTTEYQRQLRQLQGELHDHDTNAVSRYFDVLVGRIALPSAFPKVWNLRYDRSSRILVIDLAAPDIGAVEITHGVKLKREVVSRPVPQRERRRLEAIAVEGLALFIGIAIARADSFEAVAAAAVNLWVDHVDKRTGLQKRTYIASLFATKDALLKIDPANVDAHFCFRSLKGRHVGGMVEYESVEPIIRLNTNDDRIVVPREVLGGLIEGDNLAAMEWEDFEHLVRELFEREFCHNGSKVEITRASRDRGVDAIIFDPDPLRGGKYVIQAKRYTIPVDVAAVRELYGTVVNEGAMKGVLVTTSSFGPDAYSFAKDKPLTLIPGPELLGLLERHGYRFRIDIAEARRSMQ